MQTNMPSNIAPFVLKFGPQLLFRGNEERDGRRLWTVAVIVGLDDDAGTPNLATTASQAHVRRPFARYQDITFMGKTHLCMYRADIEVELGQFGLEIPYIVKVEGHPPVTHQFYTPAAGDNARIGFCSCNDIQFPKERPGDSHRTKAYDELLRQHRVAASGGIVEGPGSRPYHVMVYGGDQVYADGVRDLVKDKDVESVRREKLHEFMYNEYMTRFAAEPRMREALSTIPAVMVPDDHDFYNGVGSYLNNEPIAAREAAQRFLFAFQMGRPMAESYRTGMSPSELGDKFSSSVATNTSRVFRTGPNTSVLCLDLRCNRRAARKEEQDAIDTLIPTDLWKQTMADTLAEIQRSNEPNQHLMVLFAVPLVFMHNTTLQTIVEKSVKSLRTDMRDAAMSPYNIKQTAHMMSDLFDLAKATSTRLTWISGDAHVWGTGYTESRVKPKLPREHDPHYGVQWITSPICNKPEKSLETAKDISKILKSNRAIVELPPPIHRATTGEFVLGQRVKAKLEHLQAQRNFLSVTYDARSRELIGVLSRDAMSDGVYIQNPEWRVPALNMTGYTAPTAQQEKENAELRVKRVAADESDSDDIQQVEGKQGEVQKVKLQHRAGLCH